MLNRREFIKIMAATTAANLSTVYLPLLVTSGNSARFRLGAQMWHGPDEAAWLVPGAVVHRPVWWCEVETEPSDFDFDELDAFMASVEGYDTILGVKNAPRWLRTVPDCESSEPTEAGKWLYIDFVYDLVERYQPFAVEVWNEPDCTPEAASTLAHYLGSWGVDYAAGARYAQLVAAVDDAVGDITTVIGGALGWPDQNGFAAGFLENTHAQAVSFHAYAKERYNQDHERFLYLCEYMRTLTNAPLWVTETSYLYLDPSPESEAAQVQYLSDILRDMPDYIDGVTWYTLQSVGWENCHLVGKPVYDVWRQAINESYTQ